MAARNKGGRRRLTDRQAVVLAAVERLGRPAMQDLWDEFPDLQTSTIKKVLDSLQSKGLVDSAGDPSHVYLGGVYWWSTAISPTRLDEALQQIADALDQAELRFETSVDPQERAVTLFIPLSEFETLLEGGDSDGIDRLATALQRLEADGLTVRVAISTEITVGPQPRLAAKLVPADL